MSESRDEDEVLLSWLVDRCVGRHEVDLDADPATLPPWAEQGHLCLRCFSRMRRQLVELPSIAVWLSVHLAGGAKPSEKVSGSRENSIPLDLHVLDLIGPTSRHEISTTQTLLASHFTQRPAEQLGGPSIRDVVVSWAKFIHDETRKPWPDDNTLSELVGYIASMLSWIVKQEWVADFVGELEWLTLRARHTAPWQEETRREKKEPCPRCGMMTLIVRVASGLVRCEKAMGGCGFQRSVTDYEFTARHLETG